jgi:hypothetical protein
VNVIGHGIDLAAAAERSGLLLARCLVQAELDELAIQFDRVERLAGLFPAKGGVLRALATGFDTRVDLSVRARVWQILSQLMATVGAVIRLRKNDSYVAPWLLRVCIGAGGTPSNCFYNANAHP